MRGSITVNALNKPPLELAVRAVLAFGITLWLFAQLSPVIMEALLRYYETIVYSLDDRYWIDFALTYQTGHDKIGSDLALLGRASVMRTFFVSIADTPVALQPGQVLTCSTAIGVLMQPAIMIVGLLLGWPVCSVKATLARGILGTMLLVFWLFVGVPLSLWVHFQDIPVRAFAPNEISTFTITSKFLLNGGGLVLGALLAVGALATAAHWTEG